MKTTSVVQKAKASFGRTLGEWGITRQNAQINRLRRRFLKAPAGALVRYLNYEIRITDGLSFYIQCKDEFIQRIYHFQTPHPKPFIVDGGSNIGMSILYFKSVYPQARIIGFEPDPNIFRLLQENIARNKLEEVTLIDAGLGDESGITSFLADQSAGGQFGKGEDSINVQVEKLSNYLDEPVDFLKLNIEGQELPVLRELEKSGKLRQVREMVLEYHGWAKGEQRLGEILNLLDRAGYRYLIHDFDNETGHATKPPFHLKTETVWFCLVYAKRVE